MSLNRRYTLSVDAATFVTQWSHFQFDRPVPLVDRRDLEVGDVVASSHYGAASVERVHTSESLTSTDLVGRPHLNKTVQIWLSGGAHRTEASEGQIPLLADADGTVHGALASKPTVMVDAGDLCALLGRADTLIAGVDGDEDPIIVVMNRLRDRVDEAAAVRLARLARWD